jgi:hypothetical protein
MVDTLGREVMVVRQIELDDHGWPKHGADTLIKSGSEVNWSSCRVYGWACRMFWSITRVISRLAGCCSGTSEVTIGMLSSSQSDQIVVLPTLILHCARMSTRPSVFTLR